MMPKRCRVAGNACRMLNKGIQMDRNTYAKYAEEIAKEKPAYRLGGDGSDGTCDCIGLGIGAMRRGGIPYNGLHGTNWAARHEAVELWNVQSAEQLRIGDTLLKAREPGDPRWNLPERYRDDPDQRDYYHAGIVTSIYPLRITHMTSPTAKVDTTLGAWRYGFLFRQLQEGEEVMQEETQAICRAVVITKDDPLRIRRAPETGEVIGHAPIGATVDVLDDGEWAKIRYQGIIGYASRAFLQAELGKDDLPEGVEEGNVTTLIEVSTGQVIRLVGRWHEAKD